MLKTSQIGLLILVVAMFLKCATPGGIPSGYLGNPRSLDTSTNGRWIFIERNLITDSASKEIISGELITVQNDTFFILTQKALITVPAKYIGKASLILFKDQTANYAIATGIGLIPNIIALFTGSGVSILGIPFALVGIGAVLIEQSANTLKFPQETGLSTFSKFARFPQGKPIGVDLKTLTLK